MRTRSCLRIKIYELILYFKILLLFFDLTLRFYVDIWFLLTYSYFCINNFDVEKNRITIQEDKTCQKMYLNVTKIKDVKLKKCECFWLKIAVLDSKPEATGLRISHIFYPPKKKNRTTAAMSTFKKMKTDHSYYIPE